jgi:WD40 repeat protein
MCAKKLLMLAMWISVSSVTCWLGAQPQQDVDRGRRSQAARSSRWVWDPGVIAVSANGEWLAVRVDRGLVRHLWGAAWLLSLTTGNARVVTSGPAVDVSGNGLGCLAFSPDSKLLAVCGGAGERGGCGGYRSPNSDYAVQLWDLSSGEEVQGLLPHGEAGYVSFSPDGNYIAAAPQQDGFPFVPVCPGIYNRDNMVHIWDGRTRVALDLSTAYHHHLLFGLDFSPDSTQLAVAFHKRISLIDVRERAEIHRFECGSNCASPVFSPDGKFLAGITWRGFANYAKQGIIRVWEVDSGVEHSEKPVSIILCSQSFVPGSPVLAAPQTDDTMLFWDVAANREVRKLAFPQGVPCAFVFTPDGKALIGGGAESNPVVHMWDATTGKDLQHWDLTPILNRGVR